MLHLLLRGPLAQIIACGAENGPRANGTLEVLQVSSHFSTTFPAQPSERGWN